MLHTDDTVERLTSHSALIGEECNTFVATPHLRQKAALIFTLEVGWGVSAAKEAILQINFDYFILQDAQLSQRDRAAGCVIVFAKSRRLELEDNILWTL